MLLLRPIEVWVEHYRLIMLLASCVDPWLGIQRSGRGARAPLRDLGQVFGIPEIPSPPSIRNENPSKQLNSKPSPTEAKHLERHRIQLDR